MPLLTEAFECKLKHLIKLNLCDIILIIKGGNNIGSIGCKLLAKAGMTSAAT